MDPETQQLIDYYSARAPGFDRMYFDHPPDYLREAAELAREVEEFARGRRVLELACGTGHWTQFAARTARSVLAGGGEDTYKQRAEWRVLKNYFSESELLSWFSEVKLGRWLWRASAPRGR